MKRGYGKAGEDDPLAHRERAGPNLSGTWRLDKTRSDSLSPYLEAMGLCQIAIDGHHQKEASTETYYTIKQTTTAMVTTKLSWSGTTRRELHFGKTHNDSGQLSKKTTLSIEGSAVVVATQMNSKTLLDTKTLEEDSTAIKMVLQVIGSDERVTVVRWLVQSESVPRDEASDDDV